MGYETTKKLKRRASRLRYNKQRRVSSLIETTYENDSTSDTNNSSANVASSSAATAQIDFHPTCDKETSMPHLTESRAYCSLQDISSSLSSDSSDDNASSLCDTDLRSVTLWDDLRTTVLETNMTDHQINRILADLKRHNIGPLPKDSRTLKKTSTEFKTKIKDISGMRYYYFGLESQVRYALSRYSNDALSLMEKIEIVDNIDGLPLFKSSSVAVWPVLAKIKNLIPSYVFCVLLTVGPAKPENLDFLEEYVDEINNLNSVGLHFKGEHYPVTVVAHVCDTPARNMVKGTKSFHSYFGCDFCESKGVYDGNRMTWPMTTNLRERTDGRFRDRLQPQHHKCRSPFESSPCDMIMNFPIDFMHQGTGVILKLLKWNILPSDSKGRRRLCRMSSNNVRIMNSRLLALGKCIPNCFARRPRSTKDLLRYKATELRQLLLYTARVVMNGLMASDRHFIHLCALSTACSLLVDDRTAKTETQTASNLLQFFCEEAKQLYGDDFMVYNVHCLLHLPRIACEFGSLDSISAFCFENYLGELKRGIRSPLNP